MNEIFLILFAFLTIFFSIKISCYADKLSKNGTINSTLIGGVFLAGVTALPEFVTCFSSMWLENISLAVGDVLGSNLFNFFMICVFDLIFIKKMLFCNTSLSHNITLTLLIINYLILFVFCTILPVKFIFIGIPSIVIFVTYALYILLFASKKEKSITINNYYIDNKQLIIKIIITSTCMVLSSVILTIVVNNLSIIYPKLSSSFLGAIFLGITTSLPEVVTFYTLININNYNLAFSNIIGSNMFNLLVLGLGDLFSKDVIYNYVDKDSILIILLGFILSCICLFSNSRKNCYSSLYYCLFSSIVVILYLSFCLINFFAMK